MAKIARREGYVFSAAPPYGILRTPDLSFREIGRIEGIARLLDLFHNSGRFARALDVAGRRRPLPLFFHEMSRFTEEGDGCGQLSLKGLFNHVWRFAREYLAGDELDGFRDALRYDFCLVEYPSAGSLPSFFGDDGNTGREMLPKGALASVLARCVVPAGSRVRTFAARFLKDYSVTPWGEGPVSLVFVYVSAPGAGLTVSVFPCRAPELSCL